MIPMRKLVIFQQLLSICPRWCGRAVHGLQCNLAAVAGERVQAL